MAPLGDDGQPEPRNFLSFRVRCISLAVYFSCGLFRLRFIPRGVSQADGVLLGDDGHWRLGAIVRVVSDSGLVG